MNTHKTTTGILATFCILTGTLLASIPAYALELRKPIGAVGEASGLRGMDIDQSTGNVYAAGETVVEVFAPEGGSPLGGVPSQITGEETPGGSFVAGFQSDVAVDNSCYLQGLSGAACKAFDPSNGDVYVLSERGKPNAVDKFRLNGSKYEYVCQFTGPSACLAKAPVGLEEPRAVAVDSHGNVYVGFAGFPPRMVEYNAAGESLAVIKVSAPVESLAVDLQGDVYAAEESGESGLLSEFRRNPQGELLPEEVVFGEARGVAFDSATNRLFVSTGSHAVYEMDSAHEVVGTFDVTSTGGIAVNDETNEVYVASGVTVLRFGQPEVLPDVSAGGASRVHRTSATVEGLMTPHGLPTKYFFQYGETEEYGSSTPPLGTSVKTAASAALEGLEPGKTYHFRLIAENTNGATEGGDRTFTTPVAVEGVVTGAATAVGTTSATLTGSVEPDAEDAHYWFEYAGISTPVQDAGSASEEVPAEATIGGLQPNATYGYRLVAEDALGISYGSYQVLATRPVPPGFDQPPTASQITRAGVFVQGTVNPENSESSAHFVYVEEADYAPGSSEPYAAGGRTAEIPVGSAFSDQPVQRQIGGLKPQTTYHYAIVATNQAGTTTSADATFTTGASTAPVVSTGTAGGITANTATLTATVATQGLPTSYGFEIGTDSTVYGPPTGLGSVGAGSGEETVALTLVGLLPGTTYHYRITATNLDGASYGSDESFTTPLLGGALTAPLVLPLIATPQIAFPTGSEANTAKPPSHKTKIKHKKQIRKKRKSKGKQRG